MTVPYTGGGSANQRIQFRVTTSGKTKSACAQRIRYSTFKSLI